jgi:c-di-GMP-binding flagellar brake protein YcgR
VLLETEVGGELVSLPSFVTNVLSEELWLAPRSTGDRLAGLQRGQRVHLTFDRGGALVVESEFLRRLGSSSSLGNDKSRVFAVRRPQGVDQVQRRAHVRVDMARDVRIKAMSGLSAETVGSGRTVNVGAGGVQISTDMPLNLGDLVRIALVLSPRAIVVADGPVVRIDEVVAPAEAGPGSGAYSQPAALARVAVRFDRISEEDQERIACHILAAHRKSTTAAARTVAAAEAAARGTERPKTDRAPLLRQEGGRGRNWPA